MIVTEAEQVGKNGIRMVNAAASPGQSHPQPPVFQVVLKPRGPLCNLNCSYCYYLPKKALLEDGSFRMSTEVLELFTKQYIDRPLPVATFLWQGGEPTLRGLDFFRRAVEMQEKYRRPGMKILNSLQTNGLLLDDAWCAFLKEHDFLVGLSLDGPPHLHDKNRMTRGGGPTSRHVLEALHLLRKHGIEHNVLCVISSANAGYPLEVYRFFRDLGVRFIQFIPAIGYLPGGRPTPWSVTPEAWGAFLCAVFDEWIRQDADRVSVQQFDVILAAWLGQAPGICVHAKTCGTALAMEYNGEVFSCDWFVDPAHRLGNILERPLGAMVSSAFQNQFGQAKTARLPSYCRACPFLFACHGLCPKDRVITAPDGEQGLNYLCAGYKAFFSHTAKIMDSLVRLASRGSLSLGWGPLRHS